MDDRPNGRPADQAEERRAEAIEARNRQAVINKADRLAKSENVQRPPESENVQRPPEAENVQRPPGTEDASNELSPNGSQEDGGDWQRAVDEASDKRLAAFLEQNLQEREMGRPENVQQPPGTENVQQPPGTENVQQPPGTENVQQPPGSENVQQPPGSENVQQPPGSENVQQPPGSENVQQPPGSEDASNELSPNGSQEDGGDWQRAVVEADDERLAAFLEQNLQEREMGRPERAPAGDRSTPLPLDEQPQIQTDEPLLVADAVLVSSLKVVLTQCGIELPGGVAGIAPEMRRILSDLSEGPDPFDVDVGESSDPIEHPADRRERRTVKIGRAGYAMFKAVCDGMASSGSTKLPDWSQVGPAFELWAHRAFERLRNRP